MAQVLTIKSGRKSLSEYALYAWTAMTDAGVNPLEGLAQLQYEIEGSGSAYMADEKKYALRLIEKWKAMAQATKARLH